MSDPNRGKYHDFFKKEFDIASEYLISNYNGEVNWADADYEAFHFITDGARLIFYPHRSSCGHYSIRVRDGGSKNKKRADAIMEVMQYDFPDDNTFHRKNNHQSNWYGPGHKRREDARKIAQNIKN